MSSPFPVLIFLLLFYNVDASSEFCKSPVAEDDKLTPKCSFQLRYEGTYGRFNATCLEEGIFLVEYNATKESKFSKNSFLKNQEPIETYLNLVLFCVFQRRIIRMMGAIGMICLRKELHPLPRYFACPPATWFLTLRELV